MSTRPVTAAAPGHSAGVALGRHPTRALVVANLSLFALLLLHDVDHVVRQVEPTSGPGGIPLYAWAVSLAGYIGVLTAAWLATRGDRRTAPLTQVLGIGFAAGFLLAHALPFGPGSYWAYEPGAISWALVIVPILAGIAAVGVGRRVVRSPA
jgi:hypothetical protein